METWHGTPSGYSTKGCRCAACREAHRQAAAAYRKANKDKVNEYKRKQYEEHREQTLERNRAWREANLERVRAYDRVRYVRDREKRNALNKKLYEADKAKYIARAKKWKADNPGRDAASSRKRRADDPERSRAIGRAAWRRRFERDPEAVRAASLKWAKTPAGREYFRWQRQTRKDARTDDWTKPWIAIIASDPCCYCGGPGGHIEHIDSGVPRDSRWFNLTSACRSCNASKRSASLVLWLHRKRTEAA